ncbi:MAG TPA: nuclear transport factor 2 family protein [Gemmata sp.]|nr:nuclear transport factor 2 family protein [Gemmata sp.]
MRFQSTMKSTGLFLISMTPAAFATGATPQNSDSELKDKLLKLETQWNEAHLRGDADALGQLWAEELVVTVQEIPVMNKSQSLKIVSSGLVKFKRYETSDVKINVFGDSAVVTGRLKRVREKQGKDFEDDWQFTKVYVRCDGKWQVVAWHGSQAAK